MIGIMQVVMAVEVAMVSVLVRTVLSNHEEKEKQKTTEEVEDNFGNSAKSLETRINLDHKEEHDC